MSHAEIISRRLWSDSDLLAWRAFVEAVPEWPIDVSTLGRFALYFGIPLLGWIGAAIVQHVLEKALASS